MNLFTESVRPSLILFSENRGISFRDPFSLRLKPFVSAVQLTFESNRGKRTTTRVMSTEAQDNAPAPMEQDAAPPAAAAPKNPDADPRLKSIRIKTGSVKRLAKDVLYYNKELAAHTAKLEKMKEDGWRSVMPLFSCVNLCFPLF